MTSEPILSNSRIKMTPSLQNLLFAGLLIFAPATLTAAPPERIPSFGPNGTHWPILVPTPFLYDEAALNIEVEPSWQDIEDTLKGLTDAQANAGVRILVKPGVLVGQGSSGPSVINTAGKIEWKKRVTICPRDGYGSVVLTGGERFRRAHNICIAGFISTGGSEFEGCVSSAVAWFRSPYIKAISQLNDVSKMEFVEVVVPDAAVTNGDVSQVGAQRFRVSDFRWDGCYFAPHYFVDDTEPRPHTDTLQFYRSNASWEDWNMTIQDTAIYGSNNASLQTGGVDGLRLINSYIVTSTVSLERYPVPPGGETEELNSAINGAGTNWSAEDTIIFGGLALNNPSGRFSAQPFTSVQNSTVSRGPAGITLPQSGSWDVESDASYYIDRAPPYPTDDLLARIWSPENLAGQVQRPAFAPSGGIYDREQAIVITAPTEGSAIFYTLNGEPPSADSLQYDGPINRFSDTTLRAVAIDGNGQLSPIKTAEYVFQTLPPTIIPATEDAFFLQSSEVNILPSTQKAPIYYTLDGSIPTVSSILYEGPFLITSTTTVTAVAIHPQLDASEPVTSTITIGQSLESSLIWSNLALASQEGVFAVKWIAKPSAAKIDAVTGISSGAADDFSDLACLVRFSPQGVIDVRDGASYRTEGTPLTYQGGERYNFILIANLAEKTYDVFASARGEQLALIANDFSFRTEQSQVESLSNFAFIAVNGEHIIESLEVLPSSPPEIPTGVRLLGD